MTECALVMLVCAECGTVYATWPNRDEYEEPMCPRHKKARLVPAPENTSAEEKKQ